MNRHRAGCGVISRRDALIGLTAAAAALPAGELFGQFVNKSTAKGGRIDVHHHHVPPGVGGFGGVGRGGGGRGGGRGGNWTPEATLEQMQGLDQDDEALKKWKDSLLKGAEAGE